MKSGLVAAVAMLLILAACSPSSGWREGADFQASRPRLDAIAEALRGSKETGGATYVGPYYEDGVYHHCRAERDHDNPLRDIRLEQQTVELCKMIDGFAINASISEDGSISVLTWTNGTLGNDGGYYLPSVAERKRLRVNPSRVDKVWRIPGSTDWMLWEFEN